MAEKEVQSSHSPPDCSQGLEGREGRRGQSEHRKSRAGGAFDPPAAGNRGQGLGRASWGKRGRRSRAFPDGGD